MLTLVTPPVGYPVSLADVKEHLRITHDFQNDLLQDYIRYACGRFDGYSGLSGQALLTQTWKYTSHGFPQHIPLRPIQSITSVQYYDTNNAVQTVDPAEYRHWNGHLDPLASWPVTYLRRDAVSITFVAGYEDASDVPGDLIGAILMLVKFYHGNDGEMPPAIHHLAATQRTSLI